jgi:hypothetical protein
MIDIESEQLITFAEASKTLPGRPNVATLWRWRTSGVRGVKLESILCCGKRWTSREKLQLFLELSTAVADGKSIPTRTNRQRKPDDDVTNKELQAAGLLPA